jgi:hypothetical protein
MTSEIGVSIRSPASRIPKPLPSGPAQSDPRRDRRLPAMADQAMAEALPALSDDDLVGVETDHVVIRDGLPDLKFRGTLLASVAPDYPIRDRWRELRVYKTAGGKKVFSEVGRSLLSGERDKFEARVFDPNNRYTGMPFPPSVYESDAQREAAERKQMVDFFQFSELAKKLYAKLGAETGEVIE